MLSKERLEELEKIVRSKYPLFKLADLPKGFYSGMPTRFEKPEAFAFCGSMRSQTVGCCGIVEMQGLYTMTQLSEVQRAVLALWFQSMYKLNPITCFLASTASLGHNDIQTPQEKVLMELGFEPVHRGHNGAHGTGGNHNFVTLWMFRTSEPTPIPGLTPPAPLVKAPVRKKPSVINATKRALKTLTPRKEKVKIHGFN